MAQAFRSHQPLDLRHPPSQMHLQGCGAAPAPLRTGAGSHPPLAAQRGGRSCGFRGQGDNWNGRIEEVHHPFVRFLILSQNKKKLMF